MMTKKDYQMLARAIRTAKDDYKDIGELHRLAEGVVFNVINRITVALEEDNPRFDYQKFIEACGFEQANEQRA